MKAYTYLLAVWIITSIVHGEDWTTTDGKTYQNVKVVKIDPDAVSILYEDGGVHIFLADLPPILQKRFGYIPIVIDHPSGAGDTSPVKERIEWRDRLSQLATILQTLKASGGAFKTTKGVAHLWKDITQVRPNGITYMTAKGEIGQIPYALLMAITAKQLSLTSSECEQWNLEEIERIASIEQKALDEAQTKLAEEQAKYRALDELQKIADEERQEEEASTPPETQVSVDLQVETTTSVEFVSPEIAEWQAKLAAEKANRKAQVDFSNSPQSHSSMDNLVP